MERATCGWNSWPRLSNSAFAWTSSPLVDRSASDAICSTAALVVALHTEASVGAAHGHLGGLESAAVLASNVSAGFERASPWWILRLAVDGRQAELATAS
eukprot:scaffold177559_cov31-Tisochrysis_lutea.AAC.3